MLDKGTFRTKKDIAVSLLREAILSGEIDPGRKVAQVEIAKRLNMSPTPVREAIRELEAQGILNYEAHKGVVVAEVDLESASEVYELRQFLEARLTRLACAHLAPSNLAELARINGEMRQCFETSHLEPVRKLNYQFHWLIYEAAHRPQWTAMVARLWTQFPWDTLHVIPGRVNLAVSEHDSILTALKLGDHQAAEQRMGEHILGGFEALRAYLSAPTTVAGQEDGRR